MTQGRESRTTVGPLVSVDFHSDKSAAELLLKDGVVKDLGVHLLGVVLDLVAIHAPRGDVQKRQQANLGFVDDLFAEADELLILGLVLLHPGQGLVVPGARLWLLPQLPVGHRQEKPVAAVATLAFVAFALWTVVSFFAAVVIGRTLRRLEPIPVRISSQRVVDLRRVR